MDAAQAFGLPLSVDELPGREPFGTRLSRREDVVWLAVAGELDVFTAPTLRAALREIGLSEGDSLVLDLRGLSFMDSSGLAVVLGAHERARSGGRPPVQIVIRGSKPVESLFRTINAGEYLSLIDGPEDLPGAGRRAPPGSAARLSPRGSVPPG